MTFGGHLRRRRTPGADGPDRLVSNQDTGKLRRGQPEEPAGKLAIEHLPGVSGLALAECLTHADDGREPRGQGSFEFAAHLLVGLAVVAPAFRVADDHVRRARLHQHRR